MTRALIFVRVPCTEHETIQYGTKKAIHSAFFQYEIDENPYKGKPLVQSRYGSLFRVYLCCRNSASNFTNSTDPSTKQSKQRNSAFESASRIRRIVDFFIRYLCETTSEIRNTSPQTPYEINTLLREPTWAIYPVFATRTCWKVCAKVRTHKSARTRAPTPVGCLLWRWLW